MADVYETEPKPKGLRLFSEILRRGGLAQMLGVAFGGKRDYWEVFGYDRGISTEKMWEMYHRGGIAHRILHAFPEAVWARPPELYKQGDTQWNNDWDKFARRIKLWSTLRRADILAGLGRYSIVLVGTNQVNLRAPLKKGAQITFLQPYSEMNARISRWETNPASPRFGLPLEYTIYPNKSRSTTANDGVSSAPIASSFQVHHSRVWHIARGGLESEVYGIPRYAPVWNYLLDLIKVVGSSAESYWMTAYQGIHANIDKDMELEEQDAQDLSDEVDEFQHGYRRFIRTRGVEIKSLNSKVADPRGAFDVVLTLISGTTGIPKRILLGSEAGQLASNQDKGNWAERVEEERTDHAEPNIIFPLLDWLAEYEIIDINPEEIQLLWPEAYRMSPLERGQTAAQTARTVANLIKGMEPIVIKPGTPAVVDPETGLELSPATPDATGEALITRDEARRIIGLSTDQHALIEKPD